MFAKLPSTLCSLFIIIFSIYNKTVLTTNYAAKETGTKKKPAKNAMKIYVKMCINSAKFIKCSQYHIMHTSDFFFSNQQRKKKLQRKGKIVLNNKPIRYHLSIIRVTH